MTPHFIRYFTLSEAQHTLTEIKPILEEIAALKKSLDKLGYDVYRHQYFGGIGPNGQKSFPPDMEKLVRRVMEINEQGIEIKDLERGLIDFPTKRSTGEVVYLCYLLGEPEIQAWHTLDGGFRGRQNLDLL
jgi:hypothetical protein